jgi:uncharacterized protein (TIGR03437 family)
MLAKNQGTKRKKKLAASTASVNSTFRMICQILRVETKQSSYPGCGSTMCVIKRRTTTPVMPAQSVVTLYLIGQGPVSNTPATGAPSPSSPLAMATLPTSVSLGSAAATDFPYPGTLMYLGLSPNWVGLAQANVQLPDVPPGDYRLQLTVGGARSNVVTISVGAH